MDLDEMNTHVENGLEAATETEQETEVETDQGPIDLDQNDESETPETDAEVEAEEEGEEQEQQEPEFVEFELNGQTYQVPPELKDGYMMHADYTRKTQETAKVQQEVQALREQAQQALQVTDEELNVRASLIGINQRLDEYQKVDWNAWNSEDPMAAQAGWMEYQQLEKQQQQAKTYLDGSQARRSEMEQQETAKRLQETLEYAKTNIEGWTPEIDKQVTDFAMGELGYTKEVLLGAYSPSVYRTLHLAYVGAQSMKQAQTRQPKSAKTVKPLKTVSAKSSGLSTKDPSEMTMDEYDKWASKKYKQDI